MIIYTLGYEGAALADFLAVLKGAEIHHLVDVRDAPVSRRREFAKRPLAEALAEAGIGYRHLQGLGNPKAGREAARTGDHERYLSIFTARLDGPDGTADLEKAAAMATESPVCLMCYEADPARCHRMLVAERLAAMTGQDVRHLRVSGHRTGDLFAGPA